MEVLYTEDSAFRSSAPPPTPRDYKKGKESQLDCRAIELTLKMTTPDVLLFKKIYSLLKSQ